MYNSVVIIKITVFLYYKEHKIMWTVGLILLLFIKSASGKNSIPSQFENAGKYKVLDSEIKLSFRLFVSKYLNLDIYIVSQQPKLIYYA